MFKILGADQKEYGPVNADSLRQWIAERRANGQTLVKPEGAADWQALSTLPEFADALTAAAAPSPVVPRAPTLPPAAHADGEKRGLAIASLVLGIASLVLCLGPITGIPALITGLIGMKRVRREPGVYGGRGMALAGVIMGAVSFVMIPVLAGLLAGLMQPALATAKSKAQAINCINNLKQIGLGARMYANDHKEDFPRDFETMSDELASPMILCCPADTSKTRTASWNNFGPNNVTYEWLGAGLNTEKVKPDQVIARCPIHGSTARADGSAIMGNRGGRNR